MLKLENISKQYLDILFEKVTFVLGNREKVGLVGLNGCGKSTLLRIITGLEKPDTGRVEIIHEKVGYLPQEFSFNEDQLVGEFLEDLVDDPYTEMYKVDKILKKLEFDDLDIYQEIHTLSEGQKMKLKLAELLLKESTILLLDEPTNHLDIFGILWFEEFVQKFEGVCIIISHDRTFLNNTVTKIFEIDEQRLLVFEGNYDAYIEAKKQYIEDRDEEYKFQERKRVRLEQMIERAKRQRAGSKQARRLKAARTRLKREVLKNEVSEYKEQKITNFTLEGSLYKKKKVFDLDKISFSYPGGKTIINNTSFQMYGKDKVWFYGPNGIGKTTIIRLIVGSIMPQKGIISWGENIDWTYFSQDQQHLDMKATVEDYFIKHTGIPFERSFGTLDKFLFPKGFRRYTLGSLSPGQRARLSFAIFAQHNYNFLILDEPTNHLDIRSKEVIEEALSSFDGAILVISHDRYFIENLGINRTITIENKRIEEQSDL